MNGWILIGGLIGSLFSIQRKPWSFDVKIWINFELQFVFGLEARGFHSLWLTSRVRSSCQWFRKLTVFSLAWFASHKSPSVDDARVQWQIGFLFRVRSMNCRPRFTTTTRVRITNFVSAPDSAWKWMRRGRRNGMKRRRKIDMSCLHLIKPHVVVFRARRDMKIEKPNQKLWGKDEFGTLGARCVISDGRKWNSLEMRGWKREKRSFYVAHMATISRLGFVGVFVSTWLENLKFPFKLFLKWFLLFSQNPVTKTSWLFPQDNPAITLAPLRIENYGNLLHSWRLKVLHFLASSRTSLKLEIDALSQFA